MSARFRHPSQRNLNRFADGALSGPDLESVQAHLESCSRCLRRVTQIRNLRRAAREIRTPQPPSDLLDAVLERRRAGDRVILPSVAAPRRRSRAPLAAVAGLVGLLGMTAALVLVPGREAGAGASSLRIAPEPDPDAVGLELLRMDYRPGSELPVRDGLRVRGRYWTADAGYGPGGEGVPIAAGLRRSGDDFTTSFDLPADAVYAAFVVEDSAGERIDDDGGVPWETVARGAGGRPSLEGLLRKYRVLESRNWGAAVAVARRITELYPDDPFAWVVLLFDAQSLHAPEEYEALAARARFRLERMVANYRENGGPVERLAQLRDLARLARDTATERELKALLQERAPLSRIAARDRYLDAREEIGDDPAALLAWLEGEWSRTGAAAPGVVGAGFNSAFRARDAAAMAVWGERYAGARPDLADRVNIRLADDPATREVGIERLRRTLDGIAHPDTAARGLYETRTEARKQRMERAGRLRSALARALLADGDTAEARDQFVRAAAGAWDPAAFESLAGLELAAGDTAAARPWFVRAAADPVLGPRVADRYGAAFRGRPDGLKDSIERARREMARGVLLPDEDERPLPANRTVSTEDGRTLTLADLVTGPTVLFYWYGDPEAVGIAELRSLDDARESVEAAGGRLLVVVGEPPFDELLAYVEGLSLDAPVYFDPDARLLSDFGQVRSGSYLLLDASEILRAVSSTRDDAVRAVTALQVVEAQSI